jgi:hypothetical protein
MLNMRKKLTKTEEVQIRRMLVNERIFYKALIKNNDILGKLLELAHLEGLSDIRQDLPMPGEPLRPSVYFTHNTKFIDWSMKIFTSLDDETKKKIQGDILKIMMQAKLGREWLNPLTTFVILGIMLPPIHSFSIEKEPISILEKASDLTRQYRVKIVLDPDATIDEIRAAWPEIQRFSKEGWPNVKKVNLSKNFNTHLKEYLTMLSKKEKVLPFKPNDGYEEILARQTQDADELLKLVKRHRNGKMEQDNIKAKPISRKKVTENKTARDVSREVYGSKTKKNEKKSIDMIRQHLKRLKA